jgi:hypothetical protein
LRSPHPSQRTATVRIGQVKYDFTFLPILIEQIPMRARLGVSDVITLQFASVLRAVDDLRDRLPWSRQYCSCRSRQYLRRIGWSLRETHSKRRTSELRSNDCSPSDVSLRNTCSSMPRRLRRRADKRPRSVCSRQAYRSSASRRTSHRATSDRTGHADPFVGQLFE